MSIKTYGTPILRKKAERVTEFDPELGEIAEEMRRTMQAAAGVGLAATQVGIDKALFIAKLGEETYAFVNPVLTPLTTDTDKVEEGCLSIPGVWVDVERYQRVRLQARNVKGEPVEIELEGYFARVIQHEVDHLNGVLIIDRISADQRRKVSDQLEAIKSNAS